MQLSLKKKGLPFIHYTTDIPLNCFISSEAVWWCIAHIEDINTEADAIQLMQTMRDFELIRHISPSQRVFIHGFYLYYIVTEANIKQHLHLYTKDYLEVGFCDIEATKRINNNNNNDNSFAVKPSKVVAVKELLSETFVTLPITLNETLESYQSLFGEYSRTQFSTNSKKFSTKVFKSLPHPRLLYSLY